ncbi:MAG: tetratricopeptide repeat protein [Planctomyces sp.]|nr:tetratricopeptide repeat protein [Planctomyces sp.]
MLNTVQDDMLREGFQRHLAGDRAGAAQRYAMVLSNDPSNADAWHLSGLIAFQTQRFIDAEQFIRQALSLRPFDVEFESNLAAVLIAQGRIDEAEQSCRQVLKTTPDHAASLQHLGNVLHRQNRLSEAIQVLTQLVTRRPASAEALCNLGAVLSEAGRVEEAYRALTQAAALDQKLPQVHVNLGSVQRQMGRFDDALVSLGRASALAPDFSEALTNRGNLLLDMRQPEQAAVEFQKAVAQNPKSVWALSGLGQAMQAIGRWDEAGDCFRRAAQNAPAGVIRKIQSNQLYCVSLSPELTRQQVFEAHAAWGQETEASVAPQQHPPGQDSTRRLRVAYMSPDFRRHPTMRFFLPFFTLHDHNQFEIVCYSESVRTDEVTEKVRAYSDLWRSTASLRDDQLAELIAQDKIDILVDLAGHTAGNRLPVMASRPAPVQATFLGYPNTTGLSRIDYFISDSIRETPETARFFTESLVSLQHGACCFEIGMQAPDPGELPLLKNGYITLGSTHRIEKLSPRSFRLWAKVMDAIPDARLLIIRDVLGTSEDIRCNLKQQLRKSGIDLERVDLSWEIPENHLEIYRRIDILLDVLPWPGGTTAYESLWMGVPTAAIGSVTDCTRAAASMLHFAGMHGLVADSPEDYVELLAELSTDLDALCALRKALRTDMTHTVCDGHRFVRSLETAMRGMWKRFCSDPSWEDELKLIQPLPELQSPDQPSLNQTDASTEGSPR